MDSILLIKWFNELKDIQINIHSIVSVVILFLFVLIMVNRAKF